MERRTRRLATLGCVVLGCAFAGRWSGARLGLGRVESAAADERLETFLAHHYGEHWHRVRQQLLTGEFLTEWRLDEPVHTQALAPWEEVRRRTSTAFLEPFQDRAKLGEFLSDLSNSEMVLQVEARGPDAADDADPFADPLLNPQGRPLDEEARAYLSRMSESIEGRLQELTDWALERVELAAREMLASDGLLRYPAVERAEADPPDGVQRKPVGSYRYVDCMTDGGWCIVLEVNSSDDPELDVCVREILALKRKWVFDVRAYIASIP